MKIDIHVTSCHHSTVKCRERIGLPDWNNIKPWTSEERLRISKYSVESITSFVNSINQQKIKRYSLLDDGSDYQDALDWHKTILSPSILNFKHGGSSAMINKYAETIDSDLVLHIEDDHICFNPLKLDFVEICYEVLNSEEAKKNNVGVITFRSGLPSDLDNVGINGAWGPKGWGKFGNYNGIIYNLLGNAHHLMLTETYKKFFPLNGSSGSCEEYMNKKIQELSIKNIELQIPIYFFHSHKLNWPINEKSAHSIEWNKSAQGFEYGIEDMHKYLKEKKKIICDLYKGYPKEKQIFVFENDYYY
jgi:hypothetical protein